MTTDNVKSKAEGEKRTLELMVGIYCRGNHGGKRELCPECRELVDYAFERIDACPFMAEKTFCSACEVHCYRSDMRERIRTVMRYAGPRMIFHDPAGAIRHMRYGRPKKR